MRIALRKKSNHHRRSADLPLLFLLSISIFVFVYLPPRVDRSKSNPRHRQCCVVFNNSGTEKKIVKQSKRANDKKKTHADNLAVPHPRILAVSRLNQFHLRVAFSPRPTGSSIPSREEIERGEVPKRIKTKNVRPVKKPVRRVPFSPLRVRPEGPYLREPGRNLITCTWTGRPTCSVFGLMNESLIYYISIGSF